MIVGEWHFDEETGTIVKDSSEYGNDGTIYGATRTKGIIGNALKFEGINNNYVNCGNGASVSGEFSTLTLIAWIKPTSDVDEQTNEWVIVANADTWDHVGFVWWLTQYGGSMVFNAGNGAADEMMKTGPLAWDNSGNTWYHVALVWDGNTAHFYRDGALITSITWALSGNIAAVTDENCVIGAYNSGSGWHFDGIMDEIKIFNNALSATEIMADYKLGLKTVSFTSVPAGASVTVD